MKKLINETSAFVDEMLDGFVEAHPGHVRRLDGTDVVVRSDAPVDGEVSIVTGGGSGHEPMHAGYVGDGILDGAAAGAVFTSPSADEMERLIEACNSGDGVLVIIKNYEGDIMNFETAMDLAAAVETDSVIVDDDVAVSDAEDRTGRRGVAGTVFVHKVAGAKAAQGASLAEVKEVASKAGDNVASMGVALSSCITPGKGEPTVDLGDEEIEIGIGIHGEPGVNRTDVVPADEITDELAHPVIEDLDLGSGDEVFAMVNGLGGTPQSELYVVNRRLQQILDDRGVNVVDTWVGDFCTSLDMEGCSLTLLKVDEELKRLLDSPADTPEITIE